jgi:hypothetical protein
MNVAEIKSLGLVADTKSALEEVVQSIDGHEGDGNCIELSLSLILPLAVMRSALVAAHAVLVNHLIDEGIDLTDSAAVPK